MVQNGAARKLQKEHFEAGKVLLNDTFDDEVVYLARSKQDQTITNIREISKKRFKLTGRRT